MVIEGNQNTSDETWLQYMIPNSVSISPSATDFNITEYITFYACQCVCTVKCSRCTEFNDQLMPVLQAESRDTKAIWKHYAVL